MTLNANYSGAVRMAPRGKLEGPERGLDALVGLVILVAELLIGALAFMALFAAGTTYAAANPSATENIDIGFSFAVIASGIVVLITTIAYLARAVGGRRAWPAPLWGLILMTIALVIGYFIMAS